MAGPVVKVFGFPQELESAVGEELGISEWHSVDQERIDGFAAVTGDHQWIHRADAAAAGPYGGPIAHGFLTLAMLVPMLDEIFRVDGAAIVINKGVDRLRFTTPVPAGGKIRARATLVDARVRPRGFVEAVIRAELEVEGARRPACTVDSVMLYQAGDLRPDGVGF